MPAAVVILQCQIKTKYVEGTVLTGNLKLFGKWVKVTAPITKTGEADSMYLLLAFAVATMGTALVVARKRRQYRTEK